MVTFTCTVARWRSAVGTTCARDAAKGRVGIRVERDARRPDRSRCARCTPRSRRLRLRASSRSAIVTTAPRVSPPPTDGATTSPTSASLRSTVPVNGARMIVLSFVRLRELQRRLGALLPRAVAALTRASAWAARLVGGLRVLLREQRRVARANVAHARFASRASWSRSAVASITLACADATFACACETAA